jgi:hypothetical protein
MKALRIFALAALLATGGNASAQQPRIIQLQPIPDIAGSTESAPGSPSNSSTNTNTNTSQPRETTGSAPRNVPLRGAEDSMTEADIKAMPGPTSNPKTESVTMPGGQTPD